MKNVNLAGLTLHEKIAALGGRSFQEMAGLERAGLPSLKILDGPFGVRGTDFSVGPPAVHFPCGPALGATFDVDLLTRVGRALADEAHTKGASLLAGPNVNLVRTPIGGRNFECYSEDPHVTAALGAAYIRGVQSGGVAAVVKHYVANDAEYRRHSASSIVSERALRELYLVPFEAAVRDAGVYAMMAAYNGVNGTLCTEHQGLLDAILREEWGWDGWLVSDWYAVQSTVASAVTSLDSEMPGPLHWGDKLAMAVAKGEIAEALIDRKVERYALLCERLGAVAPQSERASDPDKHRALAFEAACSGIVLLKNDGPDAVLPLDPDGDGTIAVIGPNAALARTQGGGSAHVRRHPCVTPLVAIETIFGAHRVIHEPGCDNDREIPLVSAERFGIRTPSGAPGAEVRYISDGGDVEATDTIEALHLVWNGATPGGLTGQHFRARLTWIWTPSRSGLHTFSLATAGQATLRVDGEDVVTSESTLRSDESIFARGREAFTGAIPLDAGRSYEFTVDYDSSRHRTLRSLIVGCRPPADPDQFDRAVEAARTASVAVVVVGTSDEWETEGFDRESIALPGRQSELIGAVAGANPRTVVVVVAGSAVDCEWADDVPAALYAWFGGQEAGPAIAAVLSGAHNPAGRLPITIPRREEDAPSAPWWPPEGERIVYGEDVLMGYRGYEAAGTEPRFPFGHGLSYTTFTWGEARLDGRAVEIDVTSTGERAGVEGVQLYIADVDSSVPRPPKELRSFARLLIEPGATATARFEVSDRNLAFWDADRHAWVVEPGEFRVLLGPSSADIRASASIQITDLRTLKG